MIAGALIAAIIVLYVVVIRPRGAHILATYKEAGGGWSGVKAVFWGYLTPLSGLGAAIVYAAPELLAALHLVDYSKFPEPWGLYVGTGMAFLLPVLKAFAATPTGVPPKGE
jgi:hypothetical protein